MTRKGNCAELHACHVFQFMDKTINPACKTSQASSHRREHHYHWVES